MGRRSSFTAKQKAEVVLSVLSKQTTTCRGLVDGMASPRPPSRDGANRRVNGLERDSGSARVPAVVDTELERETAELERKLVNPFETTRVI